MITLIDDCCLILLRLNPLIFWWLTIWIRDARLETVVIWWNESHNCMICYHLNITVSTAQYLVCMMHNCSHSKSFWLLTWIVTKIRKVWFFESQSPLFPWLTGGRVETLSMEKGDGETTQVTERPFPRIWLRLRWKIFPFVLENILRRWIVTIEHS